MYPLDHFFTRYMPKSRTAESLLLLLFSHYLVMSNSFATPWAVARQAPCNFPGKNTGVGCHFSLQGIFLTQELNLHLLHLLTLVADSLPMNPLGSPSSFTLELNYRGWRKARWLVHTGVLGSGSGDGVSLEPRVQDTVSKARGPRKAPMYTCTGCILRSSTVLRQHCINRTWKWGRIWSKWSVMKSKKDW